MNPTFRQPTAEDIALSRRKWQAELIREEEATAKRLLATYQRLLQKGSPIDKAMNVLIDRIIQLEEPSQQDVADLKAYQDLLFTINTDLDGYSVIYQNEAVALAESAALKGNDAALAMAQANIPVASAEIAAGWNEPNPAALADLVSIIDSDEWIRLQNAYGTNSAEMIGDSILGMVAQGKNPRFIARGLEASLNIPYAWADNTVRTAQTYSYRRSSHLAYASNSQIIVGWVWQAALDIRTCFSCISKHGSLHLVTEILNDHHSGRCTPLPKVVGTRWHDTMQTGEEWFNSLTPKEHALYRANIRNNKLYDGVRNGDINFDQLSVTYDDPVYGEMVRQTTFRETQRR